MKLRVQCRGSRHLPLRIAKRLMQGLSDLVVAATTLLLLSFAIPVSAGPISYAITGVASGKLGSTSFSNASVTVTLSSDTSTVVAHPLNSPDVTAPNTLVNQGTATVTISGIGTVNVTEPTAIYSTVTPVPQFGAIPYVLIATLDDPPPASLDNPTAIALIGSNSVLNYDLRTSFGAATLSTSVGYPTTDIIHTDHGNLTFTADTVAPPTSQGTFAATAAIVPVAGVWWNKNEPGSGLGLDYKDGTLIAEVYSYLPGGASQWYLAAGPVTNNVFTATLDKYTGGQCISCAYVNPGPPVGNDGTITITFTSPTTANVDLPGGRHIQVQRYFQP